MSEILSKKSLRAFQNGAILDAGRLAQKGRCDMLSLGFRKLVVIGLVGGIFLLGHIWLVVSWLDEKGVIDWAGAIRKEYLTGTAITIIIALLVLLVGPRGLKARLRRCPVCDHVLLVRGKYCSDCGRKVAS